MDEDFSLTAPLSLSSAREKSVKSENNKRNSFTIKWLVNTADEDGAIDRVKVNCNALIGAYSRESAYMSRKNRQFY